MAGFQGTATRKDGHEALASMVEAEVRELFGTLTGSVVSYDKSKQLASLLPNLKQTFGDKELTAPQLDQIRIAQPRGGGYTVHFPLKPKDPVTILFLPRSHDTQQTEGGAADNAPGRMNNLSDAIALPGGGDDTKALPNLPANRMHTGSEDGKKGFQAGDDGTVDVVGGPDGEKKFKVAANGKIDVVANKESLLKAVKEMAEVLQTVESAMKTISGVPIIQAALAAAGIALPSIAMPAVLQKITGKIWMGE